MKVMGSSRTTRTPATVPSPTKPWKRERSEGRPWRRLSSSPTMKPDVVAVELILGSGIAQSDDQIGWGSFHASEELLLALRGYRRRLSSGSADASSSLSHSRCLLDPRRERRATIMVSGSSRMVTPAGADKTPTDR